MDFLTEKKLCEFLNYHNFILDADMFVNCDRFRKQMQAGLNGNPQSLKMLPTYLSYRGAMTKGECLVIDVGGTNIRCSLFVNDGELKCIATKASVISRLTADVEGFFGEIADNAAQLLASVGKNSVQTTAFCFSYPTRMRNDLDGEVVCLTKELEVKGIEGRLAGKSFKDAARGLGIDIGQTVVLNDTAAALLGGDLSGKDYGGRIGFIMGTGCNVCYEERTERIKGAVGYDCDKMIINIESGNYDRFALSDFDRSVISATEAPSQQIFEKMTAGRYLGDIFTQAVKTAVDEKVIDCNVKQWTTEEMSRFIGGEELVGAEFCQDDRELVLGIARAVVERSAIMCATIITAVILQADYDKSSVVMISAEGSTFYKLTGYKEKFLSYLKGYLDSCGRSFELCGGQGSNDRGSAFAALSHTKG